MPTQIKSSLSGNQLSATSILLWRIAQTAVWMIGATIFICLIFFPQLGVLLFWNILIPVAPALIVVAVGLWRNVCPLATVTLLPRHLNVSKRKHMPQTLQAQLSLLAVVALYVIVPLRHLIFNKSGHATAMLLFGVTLVGICMGFIFEWKSAWCSSLCPVHPVEKLYGSNVIASLPNAHCDQCFNCVIPCPDSTPHFHPTFFQKTTYHRLSGLLIVGGLPGFIWGWFHVPDNTQINTLVQLFDVYEMPMIGFTISLILYFITIKTVNKKYDNLITSLFAAAAVSCYYWFRIPALLGFGNWSNDGLLINLNTIIPSWIITVITTFTTLFFFWWITIRKAKQTSWIIRPAYGKKDEKSSSKTFAKTIASN
jgi:hypothetical protein